MHSFEVVSSETISEHPIIALRRDEVTMPGGHTARREVVEHFGAVAVVTLNEKGEVALIEQYRHSLGRRLWEVPAGLLDAPGETALETAQRELVEEAGLEANNWSLLVDLATSPGFCDEAVRVFLATDLREVQRPEAEDEEADLTLQWVPLAEACSMIMRGEINNAIAIAGLFAAQEVFAGRSNARSVDDPFALRPVALAERKSS